MANRKKEYTLDHILPERKDSYDSFYKAINPQNSVRETYKEKNRDDKEHCHCNCRVIKR